MFSTEQESTEAESESSGVEDSRRNRTTATLRPPRRWPFRKEAQQVLGAAFDALGGISALLAVDHGYIELQYTTHVDHLIELAGTNQFHAKMWFDYPNDRREITPVGGEPDDLKTDLLIGNSDVRWSGTLNGPGERSAARTSQSVSAPFMLMLIQEFEVLRNSTSALIMVDTDSEPDRIIVDVIPDTVIWLDRSTYLPVRVLSTRYGLDDDESFQPSRTIIVYSGYEQFGPAVLPTNVSTYKDDKLTQVVELLSADFASPQDASLFDIPD